MRDNILKVSRPALADMLPPHNIEAEKGVLGAMLWDPRVIDDVAEIVEFDDFYRDIHQVIYGVLMHMHAQGVAVDYITVGDELGRRGMLEKVGGLDALRDLYAAVPHAANATYHAEIVRQKAVARRLIVAAHEILSDGYSDDLTSDEKLAAAERKIFGISCATSRADIAMLASVTTEAIDRIDSRSANETTGLKTGFRDLDYMLGGLDGPQLVIVAGRPSMGKTAFAMNVTENLATTGTPVFVASMEQPGRDLAERMLSGRSRIDSHRFKGRVRLTGDEWERLYHAKQNMEPLPIGIVDTGRQTTAGICSAARKFARQYGPCVTMIDYIGLVDIPKSERRNNRHEELDYISRAFRALAKEIGQPVILLSQLNREVERREDKTPRMADLKESGGLEANADIVILVHRPEYYDPNDQPGVGKLIVSKNRNGATGTVTVAFHRQFTRFEDLPERIPTGVIEGGF